MDRRLTASLVAAIMLTSGFAILVPGNAGAAYQSYNAIRINGEGDLLYEVLNNSWTGTGSATDPYVISQVVINSPNGGAGIFLGNVSSHVLINDCYIYFTEDVGNPYGQGAAIQLYNAYNVTISSCQFLYNHVGVMVVNSQGIEVQDCMIVENRSYADGQACIFSIGSSGCKYANNEFIDGQIGCVILDSSSNDIIANNTMSASSGPAISLYGSSIGNTIINNSIAECFYGIDIQGASRNNVVMGNTVKDCDSYGMMASGSSGNRFYDNMFIGNNGAGETFNGTHAQGFDDGGNDWNVSGIGNYWSDLQVDADNDGFADLPYIISGGARQDQHAVIISLAISSPTGKLTYTRFDNITVSGTAKNGIGISKMLWYNVEMKLYGTCTGTTAWNGLVELKDGYNNITLVMVDDLGGRFFGNITVVKSDTGALISIWPGNLIYTNSSTVVGLAMNMTDSVALSTVECVWYLDSVEHERWTVDLAGGVKSYSLSLDRTWSQGRNVVNVTVTDMLGNQVRAGVTIVYDVDPPYLVSQTPSGADVPTNSFFIIKFSETMDASSVKIGIGNLTGNYYWNGNILTFVPKAVLQPATTYDVIVVGKDLSGNWIGSNSWTITTAETGKVYGMVADSYGNPIAGARVSLGEGTVTTDNNGNYVLENVGEGYYTLTIWLSGYYTDTENITVAAGASVQVTNVFLVERAGGGTNTYVISMIAILATLGVGYALVRWAYREPKNK